jgi:hypothetical protein
MMHGADARRPAACSGGQEATAIVLGRLYQPGVYQVKSPAPTHRRPVEPAADYRAHVFSGCERLAWRSTLGRHCWLGRYL